MFLNISQYSQENTCVEVAFCQSCSHSGLQLYKKETPTQVFFCEYCENFKSTYLKNTYEQLLLKILQH